LGHGQRAFADGEGYQEFGHRVDGHPYPGRRARQAFDRLGLRDLTSLDRTAHGIQLIELHLGRVQLTEEIRGKGRELLGRFPQPLQDGAGSDFEDACGGANAEPLGSARQHVDNQLHGDLLAMEERAVVFGELSLARGALELAPLAAIGMAIDAQIVPP
jgi:hypothetical protein